MEKTILILDYDGTVHDTTFVYEPAFRRAMSELEDLGWMDYRDYTFEEIKRWIGYNAKEMWNCFQPDFSQEKKDHGSSLIGKYMKAGVDNGSARLYPHSIEVLKKLHEKYELCYLSNCKNAYLEANRRNFHLDQYYDTFYSSEEFGFIPKEEIFRRIQIPGRKYIVVGDRAADLRLAKENNLPFIGCLYGFCEKGELDEADILISDITELPGAVEKISARFHLLSDENCE